ncbi:MAG: GNVR domain-containing protein [Vicinamibacterales bacterium]|jgi:polysaccharide chain length determinant protein (PEP-CTERM system associated)
MLPGRKYSPEDITAIAWRNKWLIVSFVSVLTTAAILLSLRLPDLYRSQTLILVVPQRVPESYVRSTVTTRIEDRLRSIKQEILSRSRLERIINDFGLYTDQLATRPMEQIVEEMRANVDVQTVRDDAFEVSFVAQSPRTAMIVTDRLASMVIEENLRDRGVQADGTNQFLESQLDGARRRLVDHEQKLEAYRKRNAGELPSQLQGNLQVIESTQTQIQNLSESINRDRDRRLLVERSLAEASESNAPPGTMARGPGGMAPTDEVRAVDQLDTARTELRQLMLRLKPQHPDVVAKARTIAELEAKVVEAGSAGASGAAPGPVTGADLIRRSRGRQIQAELDKLDDQIKAKEADMQALRQTMSDYQRRVEAVPGHESELTGLMRDYDTLQKIYADLLAKKENSQISANLERQQVGEQFKVLDPARLPEEPFSPNRVRLALIAAALGLFLALGLTGIIEYRDMTLRTEDEIVRTLVLPVIAAIPIMTAISDLHRQRRNRLILTVVTVTTVAGATAAWWQLVR